MPDQVPTSFGSCGDKKIIRGSRVDIEALGIVLKLSKPVLPESNGKGGSGANLYRLRGRDKWNSVGYAVAASGWRPALNKST